MTRINQNHVIEHHEEDKEDFRGKLEGDVVEDKIYDLNTEKSSEKDLKYHKKISPEEDKK